MNPSVPVSWGELVDKLTILEVKSERLSSETARANVRRELAMLAAIAQRVEAEPKLAPLRAALKQVNATLFGIEDEIRVKEAEKNFDADLIRLARAVYHTNDERARLKRSIDALLGSEIVEEKQYSAY